MKILHMVSLTLRWKRLKMRQRKPISMTLLWNFRMDMKHLSEKEEPGFPVDRSREFLLPEFSLRIANPDSG